MDVPQLFQAPFSENEMSEQQRTQEQVFDAHTLLEEIPEVIDEEKVITETEGADQGPQIQEKFSNYPKWATYHTNCEAGGVSAVANVNLFC